MTLSDDLRRTADHDAVDVVNASVWLHCPRNWGLLVPMGDAARADGTVA